MVILYTVIIFVCSCRYHPFPPSYLCVRHCVWRLEVNVRYLLQLFSDLFFKTQSLFEPGGLWFGLANWPHPRSCLGLPTSRFLGSPCECWGSELRVPYLWDKHFTAEPSPLPTTLLFFQEEGNFTEDHWASHTHSCEIVERYQPELDVMNFKITVLSKLLGKERFEFQLAHYNLIESLNPLQ